jgi:glycosyltransferase involved in cell wall biosynthesis
VPLSIFLHAGLDLYEKPIYMRQKLLDADQILTCSEFNRQFINEHFSDIYRAVSDKIHVHHHGVDLSEFPFFSNSRPPNKILAIGGLYDYKGFDYLLRAAHELTVRGIDYEVELVGDGTEAESLKTLAHQLRISDKVRFPGWVKPGKIPDLMRQATVFVHPSSRLADGVPNVLKEAMAVGTPVIASRVAGIPELLHEGKYGVLVPPKDVRALATAIETLLANKTLRLNYAHEARKHVEERHDLWRNGQDLAKLLRSKRGLPKNGSFGFHD